MMISKNQHLGGKTKRSDPCVQAEPPSPLRLSQQPADPTVPTNDEPLRRVTFALCKDV